MKSKSPYNQNKFLLVIFLMITTQISLTSAYHWYNTTVYDLESTVATELFAEANSWTNTGLYVPGHILTENCYGVPVLGGYGIFNQLNGTYWERVYSGLPTHDQVYINFTLYPIDSWDGEAHNDHVNISIDGTEYYSWTFKTDDGLNPWATEQCGNTRNCDSDYPPVYVYFSLPHTATSIDIKVIHNLSQESNDESFGIRDLSINFATTTDHTEVFCGVNKLAPLPYKQCPCGATNEYVYPADSGYCHTCHWSCATCSGPSAGECLSCYGNKYLTSSNYCSLCDATCATCTGPSSTECTSCYSTWHFVNSNSCYRTCPSPLIASTSGTLTCSTPCPTNFAYWDGSCEALCDFPLEQVTVNTFSTCYYPCSASESLYWNGTCDTCNSPLSSSTAYGSDFCNSPCTVGQYLYWNTTCSSDCSYPLIAVNSKDDYNFCTTPCSGQYLYYNQSCDTTCLTPLVIRPDSGQSYCEYPCALDSYLYWDGACSTSCSFPLAQTFHGDFITRGFCVFPCTSGEYLYWNGTCLATCDTPFLSSSTSRGENFCDYPCSVGQYRAWNNTCLDSCPSQLISDSRSDGKNFCYYPCSSGQYLYWNGSCISSCSVPPFVSSTLSGDQYCDFPCDSGEYVYWDGTCSSECNSPLLQVSQGTTLPKGFCMFPCLSGQYLLSSGTCSGSCNLPYVSVAIHGENFCNSACASNRYIYFNGSCLATCDSPLQASVVGSENHCSYPCTSGDYLYWNGTCLSHCDSPLVSRTEGTSPVENFCSYPCDDSQYLYWNGSCLAECPSPLMSEVQGTTTQQNFCHYGCSSSEFLNYDGSCLSDCPSPYQHITHGSDQFCLLPCDGLGKYYSEVNQTCLQSCASPNVIDDQLPYMRCLEDSGEELIDVDLPTTPAEYQGSLIDVFLVAPVQAGTPTLVNLIRVMQYVRYLNISMSVRMTKIVTSRARNWLSFHSGVLMTPELREMFNSNSVSTVFSRSGLHGNFLVNYWGHLITLIIGGLLAGTFVILEKVARQNRWDVAEAVFIRLRIITKWNYIIMMFANSIDDIVLYSSLEFSTLKLESGAPPGNYFSFLFSLSFMGVAIGFFILSYLLISKKVGNKVSISPLGFKPLNKISTDNPSQSSFQVMYRGFNGNNKVNKYFFLVYLARLSLPIAIGVCTQGVPILGASLQVILSVVTTLYIKLKKPLKKLVNHYQLIVTEAMVLIMNFSVFILTILDASGSTPDNSKVLLGDIIIIGNGTVNVLAIVFLLVKCTLEAENIYNHIKANGLKDRKSKVLFVQLLALPLQQSCMGFEETLEEYRPTPVAPSSPGTSLTESSPRKLSRRYSNLNKLRSAKASISETKASFMQPINIEQSNFSKLNEDVPDLSQSLRGSSESDYAKDSPIQDFALNKPEGSQISMERASSPLQDLTLFKPEGSPISRARASLSRRSLLLKKK